MIFANFTSLYLSKACPKAHTVELLLPNHHSVTSSPITHMYRLQEASQKDKILLHTSR